MVHEDKSAEVQERTSLKQPKRLTSLPKLQDQEHQIGEETHQMYVWWGIQHS